MGDISRKPSAASGAGGAKKPAWLSNARGRLAAYETGWNVRTFLKALKQAGKRLSGDGAEMRLDPENTGQSGPPVPLWVRYRPR